MKGKEWHGLFAANVQLTGAALLLMRRPATSARLAWDLAVRLRSTTQASPRLACTRTALRQHWRHDQLLPAASACRMAATAFSST